MKILRISKMANLLSEHGRDYLDIADIKDIKGC